MTEPRNSLGIVLMILVTLIFAIQDAMSRYMAENVSVLMVVMIRYWFFAAFVMTVASRSGQGLRSQLRSHHPVWQTLRGLLLIFQICLMITAFVLLGLTSAHAIFASYPLLTIALAGPVLGEVAGWRRWLAVAVGFVGVMIIIQPGADVFTPAAALPLIGAFGFALYGLMTRYVARRDASMTSVLWTSLIGALVMTPLGLATWTPMTAGQWTVMGILCLTATAGHWLLIRVYEVAEVGVVQPFAFFQLVFVAMIGLTLFGERIELHTALGAVIVVSAGVFALIRQRRAATVPPRSVPPAPGADGDAE